MRRMDYWNANPTQIFDSALYPAKQYRWVAPGAQTGANLKRHDDAVGTNPFSVRYFHRDRAQLSFFFSPFFSNTMREGPV